MKQINFRFSEEEIKKIEEMRVKHNLSYNVNVIRLALDTLYKGVTPPAKIEYTDTCPYKHLIMLGSKKSEWNEYLGGTGISLGDAKSGRFIVFLKEDDQWFDYFIKRGY